MSKEHKENGIHFANQIRITSNSVTRSRFFFVLFQFIFIIMAVLPIMYSWIDSFDMYLDETLFLCGTLVTILIYVGFMEFPKARKFSIPIYLVFLAAACYYWFPYLENGFYCMENVIIKQAAEYYGINSVRFVVSMDPYRSTTILLLLVVQVITFVSVLEVYMHYMRSVYLFCIMVFYGTLLGLGIVPPASWLILVVMVYLTMRTMDHIPNPVHKKKLHYHNQLQEPNYQGKQVLQLRSAVVMMIIFILSYAILRPIITPEYYTNRVDMVKTKKDLQTAIREFSIADTVERVKEKWNEINPFSGDGNGGSGGLDSGKLGRTGSVSFNGETALKVETTIDTNFLYLKGFAGVRYLGDEWADLSKDDQERYHDILKTYSNDRHNAETLLWEWMGLKSGIMSNAGLIKFKNKDVYVTYVNANQSFLYAPYVCSYEDVTAFKSVSDQYVKPKNSSTKSYLFENNYIPYNYYSLNELLEPIKRAHDVLDVTQQYDNKDFTIFERFYRNFVYEVYTQLPEEGLERLKAIQLTDNAFSLDDPYEVISLVIDYLEENTDYSLSPGVPKDGEDFAEYFLFDAHKGYCSHYATAATLILRNYGIPARYVEGYVVTKEDIDGGAINHGYSVAEVKDYNAHAWVEVYLNEIGWVPIEVTKGYSEGDTQSLIDEIQKEKEVKEEGATITPTKEPTSTPIATLTPTPEPTMSVPQISSVPTNMPEVPIPENTETKVNKVNSTALIVLICLGIPILIIGGFFGRYYLKRKKLLHHLKTSTKKNRVIQYYLMIERILCCLNIIRQEAQTYEEFSEQASISCELLPTGFFAIVQLALKANFSNEEITKQDADLMKRYYGLFRMNYLESLSKIKRFKQKYWKVI